MGRYFFNFEGRHGCVSGDLVGKDLPDDKPAKSEATKLAADVGMSDALEGHWPAYAWIEVIDETERAVARLPIENIIRGPNRIT